MSAPEFFQAVSRLAERRLGRRATLTRCGLLCWHWELGAATGRAFTQAGARRAIRRALRREHAVVTQSSIRRAA